MEDEKLIPEQNMDGISFPPEEDELAALLSDVKELLGEDVPQTVEEPWSTGPLPPPVSDGPITNADDVHIDYAKFYGETPPEPDALMEAQPEEEAPEEEAVEEPAVVMPPLTFYEQSRPAYQTARRAQYERERELERLARERQQLAREEEEAMKLLELEARSKKPRRKKSKPAAMPKPGTEAYAQWLYEQGSDPETEAQREAVEQEQTAVAAAPKPKGRHALRNGMLILLALVIAAGVAIAVLAEQPVDLENTDLRREGCSTILLAGVDEGSYRTDTMMLLTLSRQTGQISLVSIPRDTLVYCEYNVPKLNSAYGWGGGGEAGMEELIQRLTDIIGFAPDGYVVIELSVLEALIDQMGGVWYDVPMDMHYDDPSQNLAIHLSAGEQKLNGQQSLQLLRYRAGYPNADLGRVDVQRDFLSAALDQWVSLKKVFRLPGAAKLLLDNTLTDLTANNYIWLIQTAIVCNRTDIRTATLPGAATDIVGGSYYVLDATGVVETVNSLCNPYQNGVAVSDLYLRVG